MPPIPQTLSSVAAGEESAIAADGLVFLSGNQLRIAENLRYTGLGLDTSGDLTDPDYPVGSLYDGLLDVQCRSTSAPSTTHYINVRFPLPGVTIDSVALKLANVSQSTPWDISLQLNDPGDGLFAGGETITTTIANNQISNNRIVVLGLNDNEGGTTDNSLRFGFVVYARIAFTAADGVARTAPYVTELYLGRRRVLSHAPETPYDRRPQGSTRGRTPTRGRRLSTYTTATGYKDPRFRYRCNGTDLFGLDDVSTIRSIWNDCRGGNDSFWFRDGPSERWILGKFTMDELTLPIRAGQWVDREWDCSITEQPPFAVNEPTEAPSIWDGVDWTTIYTAENASIASWSGSSITDPVTGAPILFAGSTAGGGGSDQLINQSTGGIPNDAALGLARVDRAAEAVSDASNDGGWAVNTNDAVLPAGASGFTIRVLFRVANYATLNGRSVWRWANFIGVGPDYYINLTYRGGSTLRMEIGGDDNSGGASVFLPLVTSLFTDNQWHLCDFYFAPTGGPSGVAQLTSRVNGTVQVNNHSIDLDPRDNGVVGVGNLGALSLLADRFGTNSADGNRIAGWAVVAGDLGADRHATDVARLGL